MITTIKKGIEIKKIESSPAEIREMKYLCTRFDRFVTEKHKRISSKELIILFNDQLTTKELNRISDDMQLILNNYIDIRRRLI